MIEVDVLEAQTRLSGLLSLVESGEEIVILREGKPAARLVPVKDKRGKRVPGTAKGLITLAEDFAAPLPEAILKDFESRS